MQFVNSRPLSSWTSSSEKTARHVPHQVGAKMDQDCPSYSGAQISPCAGYANHRVEGKHPNPGEVWNVEESTEKKDGSWRVHAPNINELIKTERVVLLRDTGNVLRRALSRNSRQRISSPNEAAPLAKSAPLRDDGCNTLGRVCGRAALIVAITATRPNPQTIPVANARPALRAKYSRRCFVQIEVRNGAGSR
jgi:hypothetical protein